MRRSSVVSLVLAIAATATGCTGPQESDPPAASAAMTLPAATRQATETIVLRPPLPSGFPVLEGAVPEPLPGDDPGLIAWWSTDLLGSAAYDFYVNALPPAGYPIIGLYPGGDVALIRFAAPGGAIWQMVAHGGSTGRMSIEIRLDRP